MDQAALFPAASAGAGRLQSWAPDQWAVAPDWRPLLTEFFEGPQGQALGRQIQQRLADGAVVYPPQPLRALELTALAEVKVLILGQDPYHGAGQAEGLAFSVAPGVPTPPSLRNIYKELGRDTLLAPWTAPPTGSLISWASQGVLMLNTCLTVEDGRPASHAKFGWEALTSSIISAVADREQPLVLMLWGAHAQRAASEAGSNGVRRLVLQANHPSPLSASRGPAPFIGCGHFGRANAFLMECGLKPVCW